MSKITQIRLRESGLTSKVRERKWSDRFFDEVYRIFKEEKRLAYLEGGTYYLQNLERTQDKADSYMRVKWSRSSSQKAKQRAYEDFIENFISDIIIGETR